MKPKRMIVYAITRASRWDEFYKPYERGIGSPRFTKNWQLAWKTLHATLVKREEKGDDLPIGYAIPLEDDDG